MRVRTLAVLGAMQIALVWAAPSSADTPGLEFVAPTSITLSASGTTSDEVSVWLRNASGGSVNPRFAANLEKTNGDAVPPAGVDVEAVDADGKTISQPALGQLDGYSVRRYRLRLEGQGLENHLSGELIASADGVAPGTVSLEVAPKLRTDLGLLDVDWLLAIAFLSSAFVVGVAWLASGRSASTPLGEINLDYGTSFASTTTAAGSLLGLVLSAGLLPDDTLTLSKTTFAALNLLFGVAVVVAGLVYSSLQTPIWVLKEGAKNKEVRAFQGQVGSFMLACFITVSAVFGELLTLWLLVNELALDGSLTPLLVWVLRILFAGAAVAAVTYAWWRIPSIVNSERDTPPLVFGVIAAPPTPRPRRISLL